MKNQVLKMYHDLPFSGHLGVEKTNERIKQRFYWKNMQDDVRKYCEMCISCNQRKTSPHQKTALLQSFQELRVPFERVSMDIVDPFKTSNRGNKYILTFQDSFSRYPEAIAIKDQKAETVAKAFVTEIIARHGVPKQLLTDKGTNFVSELLKSVCKLLGIRKLQTTAYHPRCNGRIERFHRTFADCMSHYTNQHHTDWDDWIPYVLIALRSSVHSATGGSPHYVIYGKEFDLAFHDILAPCRQQYDADTDYCVELKERLRNVYEIVYERLRKTHDRYEVQYNKKTTPVSLIVGEHVFLHNPAIPPQLTKKLIRPWTGPYTVIKQTSPANFIIKDNHTGKEQVVHVNGLKRYLSKIVEEEKEE